MAAFCGFLGNSAPAIALIRGSIQVVGLPGFHELHRRALRRDVALGRAEKFVTDHKLLNRGGTQERRKVVRVEVPLVVNAAVGGLLVETHGIRESSLEQIVVANVNAAHDVAQKLLLFPAELIDRSEMGLAQDQRFEWPSSPERYDDGNGTMLSNHANNQ